MKKKIFPLFALFILCITAFAQEKEGNPIKGQVFNNPVMPSIDAYSSLSTVYKPGFSNKDWKANNWTAGSASSEIWYSTGDYNQNTNYWLEGPKIQLPVLSDSAERYNLYLTEQYQFESYFDKGIVKISTDDGQSWQNISVRTGESVLRTSMINLSDYAGQSIQLAFTLETDESNNYNGWSIKNIILKHETLKSTTAPSLLKASTTATIKGTINSLDAQKFPRFIFANMAVYDDAGDFIKGLDESNFSVTEEIQSVSNSVDKDATFKIFSSENTDVKRPVDILFLMDNSGTMTDEQAAVKTNVGNFVNSLAQSGLDFKLGLCRFGQSENSGKPIYYNNGYWYTDVVDFMDAWNVNTIDGYMEPSWDALYYAAEELSFTSAAQKIFILITDEAITNNNDQYSEITDRQVVINQLLNKGITTYALTTQGSPFDEDFGVIATSTGGKWYDIYSSFTDILDDIGTQIGNTYTLRYTPTSMDMDGKERQVTVTANYNNQQVDLQGTYTPGMAPTVIRTDKTLELHKSAQLQKTAVTIEIMAIDNVAPFTQSASLFYRVIDPTISVPYSKVSMSSSQVGSSKSTWQATIPAGDIMDPGIEYYVQATDGSNTTTAPEFLDQKGYPWSFAVWPNEAPVVTNLTDASSLKEGDAIPFKVEATDNTDNVAHVWVYVFRANQDITFQSYEMTSTTGHEYGYDGITLDDGTTEYFFVAEDNYGVRTFEGDELSPFVVVDSPWDITTSAQRHTINLYNINGNQPYDEGIEGGDVIGVFYNKITYDAQGNPVITQECGGSGIYTGKQGALFANADNTSTTEKDGFANGEAFSFKVLKMKTGNILSLKHSFISTSPTTFTISGRSYLDTLRVVTQTQQMVLKKGINLWSTYLIPEETDFNDMMSPYLSSVTEIYDDELHTWKPNNSSSVLTTYDTGYGYELYTNGEAIIRITGQKPDIGSVPVTIKGNQTGTLVGCHYDAAENVETVFSQVASNIYSIDKYTNDGTGLATIESYSPKYGFNGWTDKNMNPGEAYYVFADSEIKDFHFPSPSGAYVSTSSSLKGAEADLLPQKVVSVEHFMHVLLPSDAWATPPQTGNEVRAYNQSGTLIGRAAVQTNGVIVIIDGTMINQDETFNLRLWSPTTGTEQAINVTKWSVGSGQYDNLKISIAESLNVDTQAATLSSHISASPNPANSQVTVTFLIEKAGSVSLSIINIQGNTVRTLTPAEYPEGANAISVDVSGLNKGIYFLKVQAGEAFETIKLVIE